MCIFRFEALDPQRPTDPDKLALIRLEEASGRATDRTVATTADGPQSPEGAELVIAR